MSAHKLVETTLAAALAGSGTLAIGYPSGTNPGTFTGAFGHKIVTGSGDVFGAPQYFTLSFGASSITITWGSSSPTLPVGTKLFIQLEQVGYKAQEHKESAKPNPIRMKDMAVKMVHLGAPATADPNGYVESQDLTAAGVFSVDTTVAAALAAAALDGEADVARNVVAAWTGAAVLTITGEDEYGNTMVEASASGTSLTGKKAFKKVTNIETSANITSLTVGTGDVLGLPFFLPSKTNILAEFQSGAMLPRIGGNIVYLQGLALEAAVDAGTGLNFVCPVAGFIRKVSTIAQTGITTGGAVTAEIATVAINGLSVTVADSSSEGDVDSDTPTYHHASTAVAVGDRIEVQFAAGFNGSSDLMIVIEIEATQDTHGTVVVGNASAAQSATSADVRGTYDPAVTCDGTTSIELMVALADPDFLGFDQYAG